MDTERKNKILIRTMRGLATAGLSGMAYIPVFLAWYGYAALRGFIRRAVSSTLIFILAAIAEGVFHIAREFFSLLFENAKQSFSVLHKRISRGDTALEETQILFWKLFIVPTLLRGSTALSSFSHTFICTIASRSTALRTSLRTPRATLTASSRTTTRLRHVRIRPQSEHPATRAMRIAIHLLLLGTIWLRLTLVRDAVTTVDLIGNGTLTFRTTLRFARRRARRFAMQTTAIIAKATFRTLVRGAMYALYAAHVFARARIRVSESLIYTATGVRFAAWYLERLFGSHTIYSGDVNRYRTQNPSTLEILPPDRTYALSALETVVDTTRGIGKTFSRGLHTLSRFWRTANQILQPLDTAVGHALKYAMLGSERASPPMRLQPGAFATLRRMTAGLAIALLLANPLQPALADTIEFTDASVDPDNPVLQQVAEVSGTQGVDPVIGQVEKFSEIIPPAAPEPPTPPAPPDLEGTGSNDPLQIAPQSIPSTEEPIVEPCITEPPTPSPTPLASDEPSETLTIPAPPEETPAQPPLDESGQSPDAILDSAEAITPDAPEVSDENPSGEFLSESPAPEPEPGQTPPVSPCLTANADDASAQELQDNQDDSLIDTRENIQDLIEIINTNSIKVTNEVKSESLTGINTIDAGDNGKNILIDSGDINVFANVLNVVNTNIHNSKIVEIAQTFNNLTADLMLNHPEIQPYEVTQDIISHVCTSLECDSLSSFALTNRNTAEIQNDVDVFGQSGQNQLLNVEKNGTIRSGNVNALVNILNIANANLVNSRWTIASINVFGDWEGDLVLPSELYFLDSFSIGATDNAEINVEDIRRVLINIQNDNDAAIENNVLTDADSGINAIEATGKPGGGQGEIENSTIEAGNSEANSNVKNFENTNVVNGKWYLGMVNTLGAWSGNIFSLPDQVALATTPTGLTFLATNQKEDDLTQQMFEDVIADLSVRATASIDIHNENTAAIVNNVDLRAYSGENDIKAQGVQDSGIFSGNTYALANILNFANTNLVNADLYIGLVNVFGTWNGNILFGFPDLNVNQRIADVVSQAADGNPVNYQIQYGNSGGGSIIGAELEWHYDPSTVRLAYADPNYPYEEYKPGIITFPLGKVPPNSAGQIVLGLDMLRPLAENEELQFYAHITGVGPERNKDDNENVFLSATGLPLRGVNDPAPPQPSPSPTPSPSPSPSPTATPSPNPDQSPTPSPSTSPSPSPSVSPTPSPSPSPGVTPVPIVRPEIDTQPPPTADVLEIFKSNTAGGQPVKPGQKVSFTITLRNLQLTDLYSIVIYDTLRGPSGELLFTKNFPLGKVLGYEEIIISYDLELASTAVVPGTYTNSAYAQGVNFQFKPVKTPKSATTSFTIDNPDYVAPAEEPNTETPPVDPLLGPIPEGQIDALEKPAAENPFETTELRAEATSLSDGQESAGLGAAARIADIGAQEAQANILETYMLDVTRRGQRNPERDQLFGMLVIAFFVGIGYGAANIRHRIKLKHLKRFLSSFLMFGLIAASVAVPLTARNVNANGCTQPQVIPFPYAVQGNGLGVDIQANALITGDVRSNANIAGKLFSKIDGDATAVGTITNIDVTGTTTENAASAALPAVSVPDWEAAAALGGTVNGDVVIPVNSTGNLLGPVKINGNLVLEDNSGVIIRGNIFVTGDIIIKKNAKFELSPTMFSSSGTVIIAQGRVNIDGNAHVNGVSSGGFLLIVSTANHGTDAVIVNPNFSSATTVFYALNGGLLVGSNARLIGAYGEHVLLESNSKVTFVSGLKFASFVCPLPPGTPTVHIVKSANVSSVTAGNPITYTIAVTNAGPSVAQDVTVSDEFNALFSSHVSTPPPSSSSVNAGKTTLTWQVGTLSVGQTASISVTVATPSSLTASTSIPNIAHVSGSNFVQRDSNTVTVQVLPVPPTPLISATKIPRVASVAPGGAFSYDILVKNIGGASATGVTVTDTLDPLVAFASASPPVTASTSSTLTWNLGTIAAGASRSIELTVTVPTGAPNGAHIGNAVLISGAGFPDTTASASPVMVVIPSSGGGGGGGNGGGGGGRTSSPSADLSATFSAQKTVGQFVAESLTIQNNGKATLTSGSLTVLLPTQLALISANPAFASQSGTSITWNVPALNSGASYTIEFTLNPVTPGNPIITTATYTSGTYSKSTQWSEVIGLIAGGQAPSEGGVGGAATELPRTGVNPALALLFGLPVLFSRERFRLVWMRTKKVLVRAAGPITIFIVAITVLNPAYVWQNAALLVGIAQPNPLPAGALPIRIQPNTLIVESLGIAAPIQFAVDDSEPAFQAALTHGVAHYPGTADIGQKGTAYIFGHSSDYAWSSSAYKTIFALLPHIAVGDRLVASDGYGTTFAYRVISTDVISADDQSYLTQNTAVSRLVLQTSYPIGTAWKRFVAVAELENL